MSQQERINKAESIEVEEVREVREGVFACNLVNDEGEERKDVVLFPRKIMSETGDMVHRPQFVGKYLIAVAQESEKFCDLLVDGINSREQELIRQTELVKEGNALKKVVMKTCDEDVFEASYRRFEEIIEEVGGKKSLEQITFEMRNIREVSKFLKQEGLIDVEEEYIDFVGEDVMMVDRKKQV